MRNLFQAFLIILILGGANCLSAQQDALFTKYMFNSLVFNPAYAGSNDHLAIAALYRNQWFGNIPGAPVTQTVTAHTPLQNKRVGVGFSLSLIHISEPTRPY